MPSTAGLNAGNTLCRRVKRELEDGKHKPEYLWHGTGEKYVTSIDVQGLLPKSRLYVHLSADEATARKVGSRHGRPVIYRVAAGQMYRNGIEFRLSVNGVWLVDAVPVQYLEKVSEGKLL